MLRDAMVLMKSLADLSKIADSVLAKVRKVFPKYAALAIKNKRLSVLTLFNAAYS